MPANLDLVTTANYADRTADFTLRAAVAEIGVRLAEHVLPAEIFAHLHAVQSPRRLRVQFPDAADTDNHLAAAPPPDTFPPHDRF